MNQVGLNLLGFKDMNTLLKKTRYLSKLFQEVPSDEKRFIESIDWVTKIEKHQNIKVIMKLQNFSQTFLMQVSKIHHERYLVTFHNISKIIAEKEAISQDAEKDELTHIYNRKKFNIMLSSTIRNAEIYNTPFTLILFDIDHFKKINDTYGHNIGDKILIQLSALIKNLLREDDLLARWGGEEFVILSPSTKLKDAYKLAKRLRKEVEQFPFPYIKTLTCSFGVTQFSTGDSSASILKKADEALYRAKAKGRNRVDLIEA
jgi:diguanylate cyclase (GGDEF)-like protein